MRAEGVNGKRSRHLQGSQYLCPNSDHAEKQGHRGQGCGFFNNGAKHEDLLEQTKNIVPYLFHVNTGVVGQFEK